MAHMASSKHILDDFAQALGITASQKYEKNGKDYLADAFELIKNYI